MLGLYGKYYVLQPRDVYHKYVHQERHASKPDPTSIPSSFSLQPIAEIAIEILEMPELAEATVVNLITYTRELTDPKIRYHLNYLAPSLLNRTEWQGKHQEKWAMIYANTSKLPGCIHAVWAAVFLIEALATAFPNKHYILRDHDTTPLALYEVEDLVKLTQSLRIPFLTNLTARPRLIYSNKRFGPANAGIVYYVAERADVGTVSIQPEQLVKLINQGRNHLIRRKARFPIQLEYDDGTIRLKQTSHTQQTPLPEQERWQQRGWELLREDKIKCLSGTPLYIASYHST